MMGVHADLWIVYSRWWSLAEDLLKHRDRPDHVSVSNFVDRYCQSAVGRHNSLHADISLGTRRKANRDEVRRDMTHIHDRPNVVCSDERICKSPKANNVSLPAFVFLPFPLILYHSLPSLNKGLEKAGVVWGGVMHRRRWSILTIQINIWLHFCQICMIPATVACIFFDFYFPKNTIWRRMRHFHAYDAWTFRGWAAGA